MPEKSGTHPGLDRLLDLPSTTQSLPIALMRAREKVMEPVREMLADTDLTEQKWRVLRVLAEHETLDATRLADYSCLLLPSLTRIVNSMEKKGYIERCRNSSDRRRHEITITRKGLDIIDVHSERAIEIAQGLRDKLGEEKHRVLLEALACLAD